jgi:type II secretory pathway component PulM
MASAMTNMLDALKAAQFVTDAQGQPVAIQLKPAVWEALVAWLQATGGGPIFDETLLESATDRLEDSALVKAATSLSEPSLARVWDNSDDDIYNDL